ncbi:MAG: HAD family hydrolase [Nitrospirae bacterium]|nr:HAD family hydrolase [Nitrospirota bacterium]
MTVPEETRQSVQHNNTAMKRAVIFDFDGVILESADIKTKAFERLFAQYPDKVEEIRAYHIHNAGISRYVKFDYIYAHILKKPLEAREKEELGKNFSDMVLDEILKTPFVAGALELLEGRGNDFQFFIASGTPEEELHSILRLRSIGHLFCEAHGSPKKKRDIILDVLQRHALHKEEVVFVGDAESDLIASEEAGVDFIARITPANLEQMQNCRWKMPDLMTLETLLDEIRQSAINERRGMR